jgi:hypothetical protein
VDALVKEGAVAGAIVHPDYCDGLYCWNDVESIVWMSCRKRA